MSFGGDVAHGLCPLGSPYGDHLITEEILPRKIVKRNIRGKTTLPNTAGRKAAQKKYNAKPEQKKRRALRNKTRRMMERAGKVHKGDGKDVDHRNHNPGDLSSSNLRVQDKRTNRSRNRKGK